MKKLLGAIVAFSSLAFLPGGQASAGPSCDRGWEKSGLLCYRKCRSGYKGVGPVCWQGCPRGFHDDGAFCRKPKAYGRGTGYALWHKKKCRKKHGSCEKHGLLYYPKCRAGYRAFGCCICSPRCPAGMRDIGISCAKKSYGRGLGKPLKPVIDWAKRTWGKIKTGFNRFANMLKRGAKDFARKWNKFWNDVKKKLKRAGEWLRRQILKGLYRMLSGQALRTAMKLRGKPRKHALVVCIENNNKHPLMDQILEDFSAEQMGFYARRYRYRSIIKDCSKSKLKAALRRFRRHTTDVAILAHGSKDTILLNGGRIKGADIRKFKEDNGKIRAVFQLNCWGYTTTQAWLDAGAKAACGTRKNNYRIVAYNNFFSKWVLGGRYQDAVRESNKVKGLVAAIARVVEYFAKKYTKSGKHKIDSTFRFRAQPGYSVMRF